MAPMSIGGWDWHGRDERRRSALAIPDELGLLANFSPPAHSPKHALQRLLERRDSDDRDCTPTTPKTHHSTHSITSNIKEAAPSARSTPPANGAPSTAATLRPDVPRPCVTGGSATKGPPAPSPARAIARHTKRVPLHPHSTSQHLRYQWGDILLLLRFTACRNRLCAGTEERTSSMCGLTIVYQHPGRYREGVIAQGLR